MEEGGAVFQEIEVTQEQGMFLELGINRLARDLFLLTAVYALFVVMFMSAVFRISADESWLKEGRVVEDAAAAPQGLLLSMHIRKDGRIAVGDRVTGTPEEAAGAAAALLGRPADLKQARVILNTYRETPSILTSDVVHALADAGLDPERCLLRFTEE